MLSHGAGAADIRHGDWAGVRYVRGSKTRERVAVTSLIGRLVPMSLPGLWEGVSMLCILGRAGHKSIGFDKRN